LGLQSNKDAKAWGQVQSHSQAETLLSRDDFLESAMVLGGPKDGSHFRRGFFFADSTGGALSGAECAMSVNVL
jgi:hypothetical protein